MQESLEPHCLESRTNSIQPLSHAQGVSQDGGVDDVDMPLVADSKKRHKAQFDFWLGVHNNPLTQWPCVSSECSLTDAEINQLIFEFFLGKRPISVELLNIYNFVHVEAATNNSNKRLASGKPKHGAKRPKSLPHFCVGAPSELATSTIRHALVPRTVKSKFCLISYMSRMYEPPHANAYANMLCDHAHRLIHYIRIHDFSLVRLCKYNHKDWTVDDWCKVIWSYKTKINRIGSDGKQYCWIKSASFSSKLVRPTMNIHAVQPRAQQRHVDVDVDVDMAADSSSDDADVADPGPGGSTPSFGLFCDNFGDGAV
ncbi:hypothetical protein NDA16_000798 [Ustilago loliicola]|nr:hypothetical protein NDA16_000798 [Ustilago loliicola]